MYLSQNFFLNKFLMLSKKDLQMSFDFFNDNIWFFYERIIVYLFLEFKKIKNPRVSQKL